MVPDPFSVQMWDELGEHGGGGGSLKHVTRSSRQAGRGAVPLSSPRACWAAAGLLAGPRGWPTAAPQPNRTEFGFYCPDIFNAVQNEKMHSPYLSLLTPSLTPTGLGDPREERLNRSRQWLNDAAGEAEDGLLRKMNFLSTSLVPGGGSPRTGLGLFCAIPASTRAFMLSLLSPLLAEAVVGDCVTF